MSNNVFNEQKKSLKKTKGYSRIYPKDINQDDLFETIKNFNDSEKEYKKIKKESDSFKSELKGIALNEYLSKYEMDYENPGTVVIEATNSDGDVGEYMFVPSDRYVTVRTEQQADDLEKEFGGVKLIDRQITYSFDPKMLEKYSDIISELIEGSPDIKETDKSKLFIASETFA